VIAAAVGGINRVLISHVLSGRPEPLTSLAPELKRFVTLVLAARP
jgi:hypothetical protein